MSNEGPKKPKPEEPEENPIEHEPEPDEIIKSITNLLGQLEGLKISLPGSGARAIRALQAADTNIVHLHQAHQEVGPAYVAYVKALAMIVEDEGLWHTLETQFDTQGVAKGIIPAMRRKLLTYQKILETHMISTFNFTGPKQ